MKTASKNSNRISSSNSRLTGIGLHATPSLKTVSPKLASNEVDKIAATAATSDKLEEFLDLKRALVPQMLTKRFTKQFYLDQVHKPRFIKGSAVFFDQPYLEMLTRTPWFVVPLFWGPIVAWHLVSTAGDFSASKASIAISAGLVALGLFAWTLLEYGFHRFLFHMEKFLPSHQMAYSVHFLLHGVHHFLPMDRMRLVMPPFLFAVLSSGPYILLRFLLGQKYLNPLFSGALMAYIGYDMCHYFFHHGTSKFEVINLMKSHHMTHHYKDSNKGYGVTSILWDIAFKTTFDYSKIQKSK